MPEEKDKKKKDYSGWLILAVLVLFVGGIIWWGYQKTKPASEINQAEQKATSEQRAPAKTCDIKGNISQSTGEKIYHMPGDTYYDKTEIDTTAGERYFCSEQEARQAGWRRSRI